MALKQIIGAIRKADIDYSLIDPNDRIAVGISGGKDSLILLTALAYYRNVAMKYDNKPFDIVGIHLEMGFSDMDFSKVAEYAASLNVEYYDEPTRLYDILKLHPKNNRIQCSLCSTLKKGAIVKTAKAHNCNKTAFAHHADDAIETLFLNMIYTGRIATFTPSMHLSDSGMDFIRPLAYCFEDDIRRTANQLVLPVVKSTCPNDGYTKRQSVKEMLNSIYKETPQARLNLLHSLYSQDQVILWTKGDAWKHSSM